MIKNDPELVKQDMDSRQRIQAMSVEQRIVDLAMRFAPGKMVGWQINEEVSLQN